MKLNDMIKFITDWVMNEEKIAFSLPHDNMNKGEYICRFIINYLEGDTKRFANLDSMLLSAWQDCHMAGVSAYCERRNEELLKFGYHINGSYNEAVDDFTHDMAQKTRFAYLEQIVPSIAKRYALEFINK